MPASPRLHLVAHAVQLRLPDGTPLLSDVALGVGDERIGLVGPNGAGKSTLLAVLAGVRPPAAGDVHHASRRVTLVRQGGPPAPGTTVGDALGVADVVAAIARVEAGRGTPDDLDRIGPDWDLPARTLAALEALGLAHLPLERPLGALSGGEATRVALAAALLAEPDVLLLDEPTNDLDAPARAAVLALVRGWRRGLVVASHDRALLAHVDRIVALERGTVRDHGGAWAHYHATVTREREAARRAHDSATAALDRARRAAQQLRERQAHRAAAGRRTRGDGSQPAVVLNARRERSEGTGARLGEVAARVVDDAAARRAAAAARLVERDPLVVTLPSARLARGTTVVALEDVAVEAAPGHPLLAGVTLAITGPERLALTGPNGCGKSTLLRLLAGRAEPVAGRLRRGIPVARLAWLDQRAALLGGATTVREAFAARHPTLDEQAVRAALARFHFRADAALRPVAALSGGERMRAALACVLAGAEVPCALLLDEPTNHLDLEALEGLEAALAGWDGALVVISHDAPFLDALGITRREDVTRWRVAPR